MQRMISSTLLLLVFGSMIISCGSGNTDNNGNLNTNVVTNPQSASGQVARDQLPVIKFEEESHNFGRIIEGETVSYEFLFTNTGKTDLVIADVTSSCGCTVPSYPKTAIAPGAGGSVKVSFNSRGRKGFQNKSIIVVANTQPNVTQLSIKAQVVAPGAD